MDLKRSCLGFALRCHSEPLRAPRQTSRGNGRVHRRNHHQPPHGEAQVRQPHRDLRAALGGALTVNDTGTATTDTLTIQVVLLVGMFEPPLVQ